MSETQHSLADFLFSDSHDPLIPPQSFLEARPSTAYAMSLYEPTLLGAPAPRATIELEGHAQPVINLCSYNYLGLSHHPEVIRAAQEALEVYGAGACGSPMLSGMTDLHRRLEDQCCKFFGRESTMIFNSGFSGAFGTLSGLLQKGDVAVLDSKCHRSLIDGALLARARVSRFEHNDPESLDEVLSKGKGKRQLIAIEGIYSMDGDMADLPALLEVAEHHGVGVLIDEAHSILTCGENGRGVIEHFNANHRIGLLYGTFSKALAGLGGFVSGDADLLQYLRFYADPYQFSCALSPSVVAGVLKGLEIATRDDTLRCKLAENAEYFRTQLQKLGINTGDSVSQVVPIIIGDDRELFYKLAHELRRRGLFLAPVDYPAVAKDEVRFRASVTSAHTREDLDEALNIIEDTVVPQLPAARKVAR